MDRVTMKTQYSYKQHLGDNAPSLPRGYRWRIKKDLEPVLYDTFRFGLQEQGALSWKTLAEFAGASDDFATYDEWLETVIYNQKKTLEKKPRNRDLTAKEPRYIFEQFEDFLAGRG